jgi:hypothetical protein
MTGGSSAALFSSFGAACAVARRAEGYGSLNTIYDWVIR